MERPGAGGVASLGYLPTPTKAKKTARDVKGRPQGVRKSRECHFPEASPNTDAVVGVNPGVGAADISRHDQRMQPGLSIAMAMWRRRRGRI